MINYITKQEKTQQKAEAARSRTNEKIFDRLGELERGMATVSTQYSNISDRLDTISADLNAIKKRPSKRWETVIPPLSLAWWGFSWRGSGWDKKRMAPAAN